MCGRFILLDNVEHIAQVLGFSYDGEISRARYNIAPSQNIMAARIGDSDRGEIIELKWGLIPSWVKDIKKAAKPINAKSETAAEQPYFRAAFRKRRCLIPANGFYEWQAVGKAKQPHLIHQKNGGLIFFAGLWERWVSVEGEVIETATILTTAPNSLVAPVHNRMPAIVTEKNYEMWLDKANIDLERLKEMLKPISPKNYEIIKVSQIVNSPKNDTPECILPVEM